MTDTELVQAIRKIVIARVRANINVTTADRDLARYDLIVGLISRHRPPGAEDAALPVLPLVLRDEPEAAS